MCALQVGERLVGQATDQQKAASSHLHPVLCAHEGPIPQVRLSCTFAACVVMPDLLVPEHSAYKQPSMQGRPDDAQVPSRLLPLKSNIQWLPMESKTVLITF